MEGLMQDYELSLQHVLWRLERLHAHKEVVTKRGARSPPDHQRRDGSEDQSPGGRTRARAPGVKPGDRVSTLAWNNYLHLELYYAVPCMGAVLNTLNLRQIPQHLEFYVNDAEDKVLFVDQNPASFAQAPHRKDPERRALRRHGQRHSACRSRPWRNPRLRNPSVSRERGLPLAQALGADGRRHVLHIRHHRQPQRRSFILASIAVHSWHDGSGLPAGQPWSD